MRAKCEVGMPVVLKQQENAKSPVVMSVEAYDEKTDVATCIGFNAGNHPFKIDVKTV